MSNFLRIVSYFLLIATGVRLVTTNFDAHTTIVFSIVCVSLLLDFASIFFKK